MPQVIRSIQSLLPRAAMNAACRENNRTYASTLKGMDMTRERTPCREQKKHAGKIVLQFNGPRLVEQASPLTEILGEAQWCTSILIIVLRFIDKANSVCRRPPAR